jgi:hypothetical protein
MGSLRGWGCGEGGGHWGERRGWGESSRKVWDLSGKVVGARGFNAGPGSGPWGEGVPENISRPLFALVPI